MAVLRRNPHPQPAPKRERGAESGTGRVRGPRVSVEWQTQFGANSRENGIEVIADLIVREANDPNAKPLENLGPPRVVGYEPLVLFAVELNDNLRRMAVEIDDIPIKGSLPPELRAFEA
jgi:hypothetical protein